MYSNTKLLKAFNRMQAQFRKRGQLFEENFVASTFFLFFGFICGNLFGTFLFFFRTFIPWDGAIIALILLFVEGINYLNFTILNKPNPIPESPIKKTHFFSNLLELSLIIPASLDIVKSIFDSKTKQTTFRTRWLRFWKLKIIFFQRKRNEIIRLLNFYKLGLLLGFFIDAFKVGS